MIPLTSKTCHPVSVFSKPAPVGRDIPIQLFQEYLYPALKAVWGITNDEDYDCHGRAYRNQTADGYIPEVFTGIGNADAQTDYREVMFDDSKKALSFFFLGEDTKFNRGNTVMPLALIFMVNVQLLKPAIAYRGDEEIRNDVEKLCQIDRFDFNLVDTILGIDGVFKEFSGMRIKEGIKFRDMHPTHCFRLNFQVLFDINDCY